MQMFFYLYDDKVLILRCSLFLSNTNTEIWSKERSMSPYVAKMFFLQVDEGFWIQKYIKQYCAFQFCSYRLDPK